MSKAASGKIPPRFSKSNSQHSVEENTDSDSLSASFGSGHHSQMIPPYRPMRPESCPGMGGQPAGAGGQPQPNSPHGYNMGGQHPMQHMPAGMGYWGYDPRWGPMPPAAFMMDPRFHLRAPIDPNTGTTL